MEEAIVGVGVSPGAYVFRLHDTGEVIQRFSLSEEHKRLHGAPYTQLHRADLHDILAAKARSFDPGIVRLNHRIVGFSESDSGVTLRFADGKTAQGDLLIGADGLKSVVARQIVGDIPAQYTGDAAWRIVVPVERLPADRLEQVMSVFMGPGGHIVCYYLRAGKLMNFVGLVETDEVSEESWTVKLPWETLKAHYRGWHPAVHAIIDAADKDQCYRWSLFFRQPLDQLELAPRHPARRQSAHATLPYLAQGAAMAIEDGAVLTARFGDGRFDPGCVAALSAQPHGTHGADRQPVELQPQSFPSSVAGGNPRRLRQARRRQRPECVALLLQSADGRIAVEILRATALTVVMAGHSRPKNGVASLAYVPAIHAFQKTRRGCPRQARA